MTHDELLELWKVMKEAGIQPKRITVETDEDSGTGPYYTTVIGMFPMTWEDFGFILTGHAEKWLRERGWDIFKFGNGVKHYRFVDLGADFVRSKASLPNAVRAEMERSVRNNPSVSDTDP